MSADTNNTREQTEDCFEPKGSDLNSNQWVTLSQVAAQAVNNFILKQPV